MSSSVLEYSIVQILNFESMIKEKFLTPVSNLLQYHFCKHNESLSPVITLLFIDEMISNF